MKKPQRKRLRPRAKTSSTDSCAHPAVFKGLCVSCGYKVVTNGDHAANSTSAVSLGDSESLHLSEQEASQVQNDKLEGLRKARKLALILDLDNTLLHATIRCNRPGEDIHEILMKESCHTYKYFVKFRPHLRTFLEQMQEHYRMHIYTNGTQMYAKNICSVIDPDGKYFSSRIIARTNDPKSQDKTLRKVFLADWSMAVVIDDRMDVWHDEQLNHVMNIRPYIYFEDAALINNAPGLSSLAPSPVPERVDDDDYLVHYNNILKTVHSRYYESISATNGVSGACDTNGHGMSETKEQMAHLTPLLRGPSVGDILTDIRRQALKECSLVFSGLIPLHETANPEKNMLWRMAVSLGASTSHYIDESTTHLITNTPHTSKVKRVVYKNLSVKIVNPNWLLHCHWRMERIDEAPFLIEIPSTLQNTPDLDDEEKNRRASISDDTHDPSTLDGAPPETKRMRTSSTCSSDDEWLDQFEGEMHSGSKVESN